MPTVMQFLQTAAIRAMVRLLARWGYNVSFRDPLVLQVEHTVDSRAFALNRVDADGLRRMVIEKAKRQLADALADAGHIEWLTYEVPEYMQRRLRGRLRFYPVLPVE